MQSHDKFAPTFTPDVSVLMTVWNGERYLRAAIESVQAQRTTAAWELIVVDDGSTDGSVALVEQYCTADRQRIVLLRHPGHVNCGISASRNLALRHARAPLVAFLDCDDVFLPHHLETQLAVLQRYPQVAMVYASAERWVHHDLPFRESQARQAWWGENYIPPLAPPGECCGVLEPGVLLRWMLTNESFAPCMCTVVARTATARAVRGFENEFYGLYDDQVFHAKLSARYPVYTHCICTARYRQHDASCCATALRQPAERRQQLEHFELWLEKLV